MAAWSAQATAGCASRKRRSAFGRAQAGSRFAMRTAEPASPGASRAARVIAARTPGGRSRARPGCRAIRGDALALVFPALAVGNCSPYVGWRTAHLPRSAHKDCYDRWPQNRLVWFFLNETLAERVC